MLIALEGIDGSGKTTQVQILKDRLVAHNKKVLLTCEPTKNDYGKEIRSIFAGNKTVDQHTIAALFLADRLEHILHPENGMRASISEGYIVITDRYYLSSYAYHGAHVDMGWVIDINRKPVELLKADLHIYLDMPPESAMKRIKASREEESIEIYETQSNLEKVYRSYQEAIVAVGSTERIRSVDATLSPDKVSDVIWQEVLQVLPQ